MNSRRSNFSLSLVVLVVLLASSVAFARMPVRGSSANGEDSNAINWNLLSVTSPINLAAHGKKVVATRQVICIGQDVENALSTPDVSKSGTCDSGVYMHVFQLKSTATDVTVTLGQLIGFKEDDVFGNFGVLICDPDLGNTLELCTNDPDTTGADLQDITFSVSKNKSVVSFVIPKFPDFPAGINNQGQGLTIYIITQQPAALPIQLPKIAVR